MPDLPFVVDTKPTALAPGSAGLIVPPQATFSTLFNTPWHTWPRWADEALLDNQENAIRMRNDPVITNPLDVRTRATVLQTWFIEPDDKEVEAEAKAAADVEARIRKMPYLLQFLTTLKWDAIFTGRSAAQVYYKWHSRKNVMGLAPFKHDPINGDKLVFGYGEKADSVGIRVWGGYSGNSELTDLGRVHWWTPQDRMNLVVHRHNREDADFFRWQKAGSIQGIGLRDRLYWTWSMKNQVLAFMMDYLQWFARGLTVYYYEAHNGEALTEVTNRINEHTKSGLPVLVFPRTKDEGGPAFKPIERFEPGTASNSLILDLVTGYFDDLIRRTILGQDATTVGQEGSALGDGRAQLHETTFGQVVKWDSNNLEDTLSHEFVKVIYAFTYPGMEPGRWKFETEAPNVEQLLASAETFVQLGGTIDGDEFQKLIGLPIPKPGANLLGNVQPMQPAAVGEMPENVPTMTPPDASGGQPGTPLATGPVAPQ